MIWGRILIFVNILFSVEKYRVKKWMNDAKDINTALLFRCRHNFCFFCSNQVNDDQQMWNLFCIFDHVIIHFKYPEWCIEHSILHRLYTSYQAIKCISTSKLCTNYKYQRQRDSWMKSYHKTSSCNKIKRRNNLWQIKQNPVEKASFLKQY